MPCTAAPAAGIPCRAPVRRNSRRTARRLFLLAAAILTTAALARAAAPLAICAEHWLAKTVVAALPADAVDPARHL